MVLSPNDFRDYLCDIANDLQGDDYRKIVIQSLKSLGIDEKEEIITACNRILSVLDRKGSFLVDYDKRIKNREKIRKERNGALLNREDGIKYTGLPESTFDKKVKDNDLFEELNGKKGYRVDNLEKIARLIIDSSKSALCIETHYCLDRNRMGFLPFTSGEYYKIVEEDEMFKYLFNENWKVILKVGNSTFRRYFRIKEELKF